MNRHVALLTIAITWGGCDPIREISVSKLVSGPLRNDCALHVLRSAGQVQSAEVSDAGVIYAEVKIPEGLESPRSRLSFNVIEEVNDQGEREVTFAMTWVGRMQALNIEAGPR
jgi:hypothetical protein